MTDIELLPLPKWPTVLGPTDAMVEDYALANVAHAIATRDAEIEALRAEVERLTERNDELEGAHEQYELMKHKVITCGVAANHPDPNLSRTGAYASKWNSPQAERVRGLRDRAERLAEALRDIESVTRDSGGYVHDVARAAQRDHDQDQRGA